MGAVFGLELRQRLRQPSAWAAFVLLGLMVVAMLFASSEKSGRVHVNAPLALAQIAFFVVLLSGPIIAALVGTGIYRDFECRSHELFFATPLSRPSYYFGRFFGSVVAAALIYGAVPLAMVIGSLLPGIPADMLGPLRLDAILMVYGVFVLAPLFLIGSLFFAIGAIFRNLIAIHASGILLFIFYLVAVAFGHGIDSKTLGVWLDPYGGVAIKQISDYWTPAQQNASMPPLDGLFLLSRVLWMGIGAGALGIGLTLFSPTLSGGAPRRALYTEHAPILHDRPDPGRVSPIATLLHLTGFYLRSIIRTAPFLLVLGALIVLLWIGANVEDGVGGAAVFPVTRRIADSAENLATALALLAALFAGELVWRESGLRVAAFVETARVSRGLLLASRFLALALSMAIALLVLIAAGMLFQLTHGWTRLEPLVYIEALFGVVYPGLLFLIALSLALHTLAPSKVTGHVFVVLYFGVLSAFGWLGWDHALIHADTTGSAVYSDLNGWNPFVTQLASLIFHRLLIAGLLLLLALRIWPGAFREPLRFRWKQNTPTTAVRAAFAALVVGFLLSCAWIVFNVNFRHHYRSEKTVERMIADYEKRYAAAWRDAPQPRVTDVSLDIDLHPERRQYSVNGRLTLTNKTGKPLPRIVVDVNGERNLKRLEFDRPATTELVDKTQGFRVFKLATPLAPGESVHLNYTLTWDREGFPNGTPRTDIAANGTFLHPDALAPKIGYNREGELSDPQARKRQGLSRKPAERSFESGLVHNYIGDDADAIHFEAIVRTAPDQMALAPGDRVREWTENGRRCFQYRLKTPTWNFYAIVSGRYAVQEGTWRAPDGHTVPIEVWYHPDHGQNVDSMIKGAKASLSFCSTHFAPYPHRYLRIVEFPAYAAYAQSFPGTIPYSEDAGFIFDTRDAFDSPFYITAHEVAHQWWAHQLLGADLPGSEMLSESLAEYTALKVVAQTKGTQFLDEYQRRAEDSYLKARAQSPEPESPLRSTRHQGYIHYQKGSLVFAGLDELWGGDHLDKSLRRFLETHRNVPPYPTADDLLRQLHADAPASLNSYIVDSFEKIVIHDIAALSAKAEPVGAMVNGKWRGTGWKTTIHLRWKKLIADGAGREVETRPDDLAQIRIEGDGRSRFETVRVRRADDTVTVQTPFEPTEITLDPHRQRIERERNDNTATVDVTHDLEVTPRPLTPDRPQSPPRRFKRPTPRP